MATLVPLMTGLTFPEGPRWKDGRLWFSDFYSHWVYSVDLEGNREAIVEVPGQPSGLGWLPDGDLLIVSMIDQKVMRWDGETLNVHADLAGLVRGHCNDMIVLPCGRAYVGNFGFDPHREKPRTTTLVMVESDGSAKVAATEMAFPNGMVTLNGEKILVIAESVSKCLTAFDIAPDGSLSNRRILVGDLDSQPDGICLDRNGNILVTTMDAKALLTFSSGGQHLDTKTFDVSLWACAVNDAGDILLCTSHHSAPDECETKRSGAIQRVNI